MTRGKNVYISESGGTLNVRSGPGTNYSVRGYVNHGDSISIVSLGDEWSKITVTKSGITGYIKSKYIYGYSSAGWNEDIYDDSVYSYEAGIVVTKYKGSTVNIRSSASTSGAIKGAVTTGDYLKITGVSGNWYRVTTCKGLSGYIYKSYVSYGAPATTTTKLNVRAGASSKTTRLTTLKTGASVTIYDVDGHWAYVRYGNNSYGYVSMNYLKY